MYNKKVFDATFISKDSAKLILGRVSLVFYAILSNNFSVAVKS